MDARTGGPASSTPSVPLPRPMPGSVSGSATGSAPYPGVPRPMYAGGRPVPSRPQPYPPNVSSVANGVHDLSLNATRNAPTAMTPLGMQALNVTDAASLPRPDLTGPAVAVRISSGDPLLTVTSTSVSSSAALPSAHGSKFSPYAGVDPAACPPEMFVPASPRCVRLTNSVFPATKALAVKYGLPLGAVIQPLASPAPDEDPVPVVNFGTTGIVRCNRCRSYVNFTSSFKDGGRRWVCSLCACSNETPSDYFAPLDYNGKRTDAANRPELHRSSVEFVAPAEYMVRPPMPPVYMFLFETTPTAVNSGVLATAIAAVRNSINAVPNEGRTRIGLMTFDSVVQFYSMRPGPDAEPSVYVVSDIDDMFIPVPDGLLVQLSECRECFEKALDLIENTYTPSPDRLSTASCLGSAMEGAQKVMEFVGGKLVVVACLRPTSGSGALRERGDVASLGTDRERGILRPETSFYNQFAVTLSKCQIGCDLFLCPPPPGMYVDVASLAQLSKFTGGEVFYCPSFEAIKDSPRLQLAINRVLSRETGLEAVMRIRAPTSVRCFNFGGRFFVRSTDLLAMPSVDCDKAFTVQFSIQDVNVSDGPFCLQVALLYTTTSGERRIRVHTVAVPFTSLLADLFARMDVPATGNMLMRMAADGMKERVLDELRRTLVDKVVNCFSKFKDACSDQHSSVGMSGQIVFSESMKLLPLFVHGIGRSAILCRDVAGAYMYRFDDKAALAHDVDVMSVAQTSAMAYPNIITVYPWPSNGESLVKHPDGAAAVFGSLRPDRGILIDDGRSIVLWLGESIVEHFLTELFGGSLAPNAPVRTDARLLGIELMRRGASAKGVVSQVHSAVNTVLSSRRPSTMVSVVLQGDRGMEGQIQALMVEERTASVLSYHDFLLEMQRRISQSSGRK